MQRPDSIEVAGMILRVKPRFAGSRYWRWEIRPSSGGDPIAAGPVNTDHERLKRRDAIIVGGNELRRLAALTEVTR